MNALRGNPVAKAAASSGTSKAPANNAAVGVVSALAAHQFDAVPSVKFVHGVQPVAETAKRYDHVYEVRETFSTTLALCPPLEPGMFAIYFAIRGRALRYLVAVSLLVASAQITAAQYIMQPSLGGTYSYGPESKSESAPFNQKTKRTSHRRSLQKEKNTGARQGAPRLPRRQTMSIGTP